MTYATKQDLIDRYGAVELARLTDRVAATTIDDTVVARALGDADALINSHLARRVTTPLDPVPSFVTGLACQIARYQLHEDHAPDRVKEQYKDAVKWLEAAGRGDVALGDTIAPTEPSVAELPIMEGPRSIFGRDKVRGF